MIAGDLDEAGVGEASDEIVGLGGEDERRRAFGTEGAGGVQDEGGGVRARAT